MKKNVYGVTGYPTPDATTERICRTFQIPNSTLALGAFMGALWPLVEPEAWQEYGDMTPDEAAEMMQTILWEVMLAEDVCAIAETPYWDTAANVDDTLPIGSETWYGQIVEAPALLGSGELTFLDNLGIWAVAGFIAYAGLPGAAIAFVPVAQRFVLAFKQHDLGGIVKVLIDFLEVAEIDTYGVTDAIQNLNVVMPDDGESHTLYVMMSDTVNPAVVGDPQIQVVRKELSPAQVTPTTLRWNPDTNTVQQTPDGGTTWIDNPSADPRAGAGFQLPPRGGSDPKCDAAENMVVKLKSMVNIFEQEIAQLQAVNAFVDIVLVFLPEVGIVLEALLAATEFILTIGSSAISAAFTDDEWGIVKCILYCDIASDGTVNQTQFDKILDDMHTKNSTVVYDVLYTIFTLALGVNGVSNAGATGDATGDCTACDCCPDFYCTELDFTLSNFGILPALGTWVDGVGFEQAATFGDGAYYNGVWLAFTVLSGNITSISFEFTGSAGSGLPGFTDRIYFQSDLVGNWVQTGASLVSSPFSVTGSWDGKTIIGVTLTCGHSNPASGTITLTKVTVQGAGCSVVDAVGAIDCS